jgi:hypothetical protein
LDETSFAKYSPLRYSRQSRASLEERTVFRMLGEGAQIQSVLFGIYEHEMHFYVSDTPKENRTA